jgi:heptosyltransferase-2
MGDLVLAETLFSALRERNPHARLELLCRQDVAPVVGLYARPPDAVHAFPFDPYRWGVPSDLIAAEIREVAARVGTDVACFISAELRATALSEALAAVFASPVTIIGDTSGRAQADDVFILLRKLGVATNPVVRRLAHVPKEHELDRYARLADAPERRRPSLRPAQPGNGERRRLEVFPFGSAPLNRWPLERTVAAAERIAERYGLDVRLVGSEKQRPLLENLAAMFARPPDIFAGTPARLPTLAEELTEAFGYVGVDTGLVHLAAAYGVPGVTIYGGEMWPAYAPWQTASAGVLAPIPCFGCSWDCAFEHAFCIDGVDVDAIVKAFDAVAADGRAGEVVVELEAFTSRERAILEAASNAYRKAQADRLARLAVITRLRDILRRYAVRATRQRRKANASLRRLTGAAEEAVGLLEPWKARR